MLKYRVNVRFLLAWLWFVYLMAALTNLDDYIARLTASTQETINWYRDNRSDSVLMTAPQLSRLNDLWELDGIPPRGNRPASGTPVAPDRTTPGALGQTNPTGGEEKFLTALTVAGGATTDVGAVLLFDRLLHNSGLDGSVTSPQDVSGGTLTRYTGAQSKGNRIGLTIYDAIGNTARTVTADYTNQDGVSGQITEPIHFGGTGYSAKYQLITLPFAQGDSGVQTVDSITISASTVGAGDFGLTIYRPLLLAARDQTGGSITETVFTMPVLPKIVDDACLCIGFYMNLTSALYQFYGQASFITK